MHLITFMANSPQSIKRARQAEKRRRHNQGIGTKFRTMVKRARATAGKKEAAEAFATMQSAADSAARKGIIHPRKAARLKKRINALLRKQGGSKAAATPAAKPTPAASGGAATPA